MNIKEVALYSVFGALVIAVYLLLAPFYLLVFTVFVLSLNIKGALLFGLLIGITTGIVHPKLLSFTNVLWLPMIAFGLKAFEVVIYGGKLSEGCLSHPKRYVGLRLGIVAFIFIVLANIGSEIAASWVQDLGIIYVIASLPIALGLAAGTALIIGFVGVPLQKRISKLLYTPNA